MTKLEKVMECVNNNLENGQLPPLKLWASTTGHRLSRCANTGIVIDSSSQNGAFVVPAGEGWTTFENAKLEYRWLDGVFSTNDKKANMQRDESKVKSSKETMSYVRAMSQCLVEVAKSAPVVTLFRSIDSDGSPRYHGLLKWLISGTKAVDKCLVLVGSRTNKKETQKREIKWGQKDASEESNQECLDALARFVNESGGPHG
ncbi:hypothetical protein QQZ08_004611 [Neonectria magnoliae]|uniref:Uncharacterized protein n=1 Tax=Neonectria magnoliae TaxID=2732573 RepID=A0ABR1I677_9HYPO